MLEIAIALSTETENNRSLINWCQKDTKIYRFKLHLGWRTSVYLNLFHWSMGKNSGNRNGVCTLESGINVAP